jgi:hypothetical protein
MLKRLLLALMFLAMMGRSQKKNFGAPSELPETRDWAVA